MKKIMLLLGILVLPLTSFAQMQIRYAETDAQGDQFVIGALKLALERSGAEFRMEPIRENLSEGRKRTLLSEGNMEVYWSMTSSELEGEFEPVRFPVYKGLLGNRIFIIRQGEQHRYDAIKTFADLQRFNAGQGKLWPDTQILQSGNISVRTTMDYENLFYMLEGGRFDYFPRGIHEPFQEVEARPELNLVVENNIMLVYRAPMYFFVRKDNKQLAERIHQGLDKALEDGSFDEFFFSNAMIQDVLSKANIKQRNVFFIDNPLLTPQTPLERKEYWLNIEEL